jgi:hypothetical protein
MAQETFNSKNHRNYSGQAGLFGLPNKRSESLPARMAGKDSDVMLI